MISVTVLTKNSHKTLWKTLNSLKNFPEVLVYDSGSSDNTLEIARQFPNVAIKQGSFEGFGKTHNRASELATHDWILSIDSDEELSGALCEEILNLKLDPNTVYELPRHNYFNNKHIKWCSGWHPDPILRLYNRTKTRFNDLAVHEKIETKGLKVCSLHSPLYHTPYLAIDDFLHKMQHYSTLFAKEYHNKKSASLFSALWHGFFAFFKSYILKRGILGGKEGLIISLYNGHTTYYKYLKLCFASGPQNFPKTDEGDGQAEQGNRHAKAARKDERSFIGAQNE